MRGAPESGEVSRRHAGSEHRGSRAAAVPRRRRRRRGTTSSGIAACGGSTARDCREVSRRGAARPRAFPMNISFIGAATSAACGFQVRATDSCHGPVRGLLRRQRQGRADAGPRKHQASSPRERCLLCRSRGIPGPFGIAWTAKGRCRHAISATEGTDAVNPNPRRSSHVQSAGQRPYAQAKEGGVHRRCRRLGGGQRWLPSLARASPLPQARAKLRGSIPTSRFRPGWTPC